jgi:CubicO group peptidase (beta-lactamase class C family)
MRKRFVVACSSTALLVAWVAAANGGAPQQAQPAAEPVARMPEARALAAADKHTQELCAAGQFSGVMLVARGGKNLLSRACGDADREKRIPNRVDTKINLGSMNKMFTATAVMQLVEQGKIRVEDPVGKYLAEYPNRDVAGKVTIHQLLTHTGGTGDVFGPEFRENREKLKNPADYLALYGTRAPLFEPGSRYEYSNYGFEILGAIIEKVSGQSYYDYVREHIFAPAGMKNTDSYFEAEPVANRAVGYTNMMRGKSVQPNTAMLPPRGSPAGGGYSTAEDLVRFAEALLGHRLLNAQFTELLTTGKISAGPPGHMYAYGFHDIHEDGVRLIGHNGGGPGINASLEIFPESGYVVVVLANLDPPAAENLANFIGARLPAK